MIKFRIGLGQTKSGKILDRDTKWAVDKNTAIELHKQYPNKPLFVSVNGYKYKEITYKELLEIVV